MQEWDLSGIERGGIHRDPEAHLQFQESCTGHSCTTLSGQVLKESESPLGISQEATKSHPRVTSTRASSLGVRSMSTASPSSERSMISSPWKSIWRAQVGLRKNRMRHRDAWPEVSSRWRTRPQLLPSPVASTKPT